MPLIRRQYDPRLNRQVEVTEEGKVDIHILMDKEIYDSLILRSQMTHKSVGEIIEESVQRNISLGRWS